ncbi:MAG: VOC family protein [Candidatus Binataceae bacterium]
MESGVGILDHIAVVVRNLKEARKFYEGVLGGRFMYELEQPEKGYRLCKIELYRLSIELLEPLGPASFLQAFLNKRGEGLHHVTFNLPGAKWETERLKECGVEMIDDTDTPARYESFISPRSSHGVLIQFISGYSAWSLANEYEQRRRDKSG